MSGSECKGSLWLDLFETHADHHKTPKISPVANELFKKAKTGINTPSSLIGKPMTNAKVKNFP